MDGRSQRTVREPEQNLPFHVRQEFRKPLPVPRDSSRCRKVPENMQFSPSNFRVRSRSRTASRRSSISSFNVTDSAAAGSPMTMASPLSSIYASDIQERFACHGIDESRPSSRFHHGRQMSAACSNLTFEDDQDIRRALEEQDVATPEPGTPSTANTPVKMEHEEVPLDELNESERNSTPCASPKSVSASSYSSHPEVTRDDVDSILNYTMQLVYGTELAETMAPMTPLRKLVTGFIEELGQHTWQAAADGQAHAPSGSSGPTSPFFDGSGDGSINGSGKRKKQSQGDEGDDGVSDGEGSGSFRSKKRRSMPKEDDLRLSCPYRKRNPHRFNVRDNHSCAMTYFPKFAELRQHIVKQHKRDDPSAFVCDRCSRDFWSRKELREHQRQPKELMCDISDHDPEAGIDGPTSNKLLSRKRISGASTGQQWKEIWNIVFPDDDDHVIRPYQYTPVVEHFELAAKYVEAVEQLESQLRKHNDTLTDALGARFRECFTATMAETSTAAQNMHYVNRSNKRSETTRYHSTLGLTSSKPKGTSLASGPDSGVALDDGSEESYNLESPISQGVRTAKTARPQKVPGTTLGTPTTRILSGLTQSPMRALAPLPLAGSKMAEAAAAVEDWTSRLPLGEPGDLGMPDPWTSTVDMNTDEFGVDAFLFQSDFAMDPFGHMDGVDSTKFGQ